MRKHYWPQIAAVLFIAFLGMPRILGLSNSVRAVTNGQEALDAISRTSYDLILMDCQIPEINGFEATKKIKAA